MSASPDTGSAEEVRRALFVEVARLRQRLAAASPSNVSLSMDWMKTSFWIHPGRLLVLPARTAARHGLCEGVEPSDEVVDDLEHYGPRGMWVTSREFIRLWASWSSGLPTNISLESVASSFLHYAVVQPIVNPAFGPLFWLVASLDSRLGARPAVTIADVLGSLAYDALRRPVTLEDETIVRRAQVEFVLEEVDSTIDEQRWREADVPAWTAKCESLLQAQLEMLDLRVFRAVTEVISRVRSRLTGDSI